MRNLIARSLAFVLALAAPFAFAAEEGVLAPEPTVSVFWVGVFFLVFIGVCVWFGVAMVRADRKNKAEFGKEGKSGS